MLYVGIGLVVIGFAVAIRWRGWRASTAGVLSALFGLAAVIETTRKTPPPFRNDEVGRICYQLSRKLVHVAFKVGLARGSDDPSLSPRPMRPEIVTRFDVIEDVIHGVSVHCFQTPGECMDILDAADPDAADFEWRLSYLAFEMRRNGHCAATLPPQPSGDDWRTAYW